MYTLLPWLTWKYLYKTESSSLRTMFLMSFISISLSCALLLIGISIMNGFERETYAYLRTLYADLTMKAPSGTTLAFDAIKSIFDEEFPTFIYKPKSTFFSIITSDTTNTFALLIAVNPRYESKEFSVLKQSNMVVIPSSLAHELGVTPGNNIDILCALPTENSSIEHITLRPQVGALVHTESGDTTPNVYCSFDFLRSYLQEKNITEVAIYIPTDRSLNASKQALAQRFGLPIYSWSDRYPSLAASLRFEKYVIGSILALIVILAICTLISTISIFLTQKIRDIALLKTMGISMHSLRLFCYIFGLSIPMSASFLGLLLGSLVGLCANHYKVIPLPDSYITSYLPFDIHLTDNISIFLFVILLSCIIIGTASKSIRTLIPAHILKVE